MTVLPEPPAVELEILRELPREDLPFFLTVRRVELLTRRAGRPSFGFPYDIVERRALDAAVMVAHHLVDGVVHVWLRSAVRPPVALRPIAPRFPSGLWEVPAGLIEPGESPHAAAARELEEELGFVVDAMLPLGASTFPAPGCIGELQHYFHVRVDPETRREPRGDGHPLEDGAIVLALSLADALEACRAGELPDGKTELALRRLAEVI